MKLIKMKIVYVLISCVFVNVSAYDLRDYRKEVAHANAYIELIYNKNNFYIESKLIQNGLEHVIKTLIDEKDYSISQFNLMITVPESAYISDSYIRQMISLQTTLQTEIKRIAQTRGPDEPNPNWEDLDLKQLGEERRIFIRQALKNILKKILNFEIMTELADKRRLHTTGGIRNRTSRAADRFLNRDPERENPKYGDPKRYVPLRSMCLYIALFMSTKFPTEYIEHYKLQSDKTCKTTNVPNITKTYKEIDDVWYEVNNDDTNIRIQPLKELIL